MGFLEELGKVAVQSVAKGIAKGIQASTEREAAQRRQAARNSSADERAAQQAAENGDLDAIQYLATNAYEQNDYQNAIYWAEKGAAFDDEICLYVLGDSAYSIGDHRTAESAFIRNVNVNGNSLSATSLGYIYFEAKDIDNAAHYFELALRADENNGEAALGFVNCVLDVAGKNNADPLETMQNIKPFLQIAARSQNYQTREGARQLLQQVQETEAELRQKQQNSGCYVTTAVCDTFGKPDDCFELTTFRNFRDTWLINQPDGKALIAEYYDIAPRIVDNINRLADAAQIYKSIWQQYLEPCLNFIRSGDNLSCKNKYIEMVSELKRRYL